MTEESKTQAGTRNRSLVVLGLLLATGIVLLAIVAILTANDGDNLITSETDDPEITGVTVLDPARELVDFTLPASTGGDISLGDFAGRAVLVYFGYTNCPDFCPPTLLDYTRIKALLGDDAEQVAFVFISVDPQRDTIARLTAFINRFDPEFVAMQADDITLQQIQADYDIVWALNQSGSDDVTYTVDHTISKFLIDPDGNLARIFSFGVGNGTVVENIRQVLEN